MGFFEKPINFDEVPNILRKHNFGRKILNLLSNGFVLKEEEGFLILLDLRDRGGVSKYVLKHGRYDPFLSTKIKRWIGKNGSMIDVGANIGYYSLLAASSTSGTIYAFEPDPYNYRQLEKNIELNNFDNIKPYQLALSDNNEDYDAL